MGSGGWAFIVYGAVIVVFFGIIAYSVKATRADRSRLDDSDPDGRD
ncbi:hypothetical protein [Mycobacterium asiaticum]|nr:hypothetical protein [Mycobacterium asiaticum]